MNSSCNSNSSRMVSFPTNYAVGENTISTSIQNNSPPLPTSNSNSNSNPSFLTRVAMRISRSKCFTFLRRVFHYQNGTRSDLGSNPFNSSTWMMLELIALIVQITATTFTLVISKNEKPVWPMRVWVSGYDIACVLNVLLLCGRYYQVNVIQGGGISIFDVEQQTNDEETRYFKNFSFLFVILLLIMIYIRA